MKTLEQAQKDKLKHYSLLTCEYCKGRRVVCLDEISIALTWKCCTCGHINNVTVEQLRNNTCDMFGDYIKGDYTIC